jgi:O-antigen ligase
MKAPRLKIVGGLAAALLAVLVFVSPQKIIRVASQFRKGSTISRGVLYRITLAEAVKKPVLGHGFKPRVEDSPLPVGSHSTYIGVLYKTGFLGLLILGAFWLAVLRTWWRQRPRWPANETLRHLWTFGGVALLAGLIWMFAEDLDAQPIASYLYFILIGLIISLEKAGNAARDPG